MTLLELLDAIKEVGADGVLPTIELDATVEGASKLLIALDAALAVLKTCRTECEQFVADVMPGEHLAVEGTVLERSWQAGSEKWDTEALVRVVVARARDERRIDKETGEPLESEGDAIARVIVECAPFTPSMKWRKTPLKARHIDIDEFVTRSPGHWKVRSIA